MSKQQFDLNDEARRKINDQYEYADERVSSEGSEHRSNKPYKAVPRGTKRAAAPSGAKNRPVKKPAPQKKPVRREPQPAPPPEYEPYEDADYAEYDGYAPEQPAPEPQPRHEPGAKRSKLLRVYRRIAVVIIILGAIYIALNVGFLYFRGQLWFNEPRKRDYPVRGAVVTSDLGEVDWHEFQYQSITFAYVRATRGSKYVDDQYASNRKGVDDSKLWAGFYHEFDFSADGEKQAENYINTVGDLDGELRPAVKLTAYGAYKVRMKSAEKVKEHLDKFLKRIKQEYGRRAVIMCDEDCYEKYVKPYYSDQTLWLIDYFSEPKEGTEWAIWEFNPRVRSEGYVNKKEYYSVVVYRLGKDIPNFRKNFEIGYE